MSKSEVPKFELPILYLCLLIFFAGLGWMVSVFLLGKIYSANMTVHYLTSLIWEILKIIFIGTSVAIIVNQFILKPILSMPQGLTPPTYGIADIYPARTHESAISHFEEIVNDSVNQTVMRSINTSFTTLLILLVLFFFGGETIKYFVLALIAGVIIGTYSSIFVASPLVVSWYKFKKKF